MAKRKIERHSTRLRQKKLQEISEAAARARSILHSKARQYRASAAHKAQQVRVNRDQQKPNKKSQDSEEVQNQELGSTKSRVSPAEASKDVGAEIGK